MTIPEWVSVWGWMRRRGDNRWLPQQADALRDGEGVISVDDYERMRRAWLEAGAPKGTGAIGAAAS